MAGAPPGPGGPPAGCTGRPWPGSPRMGWAPDQAVCCRTFTPSGAGRSRWTAGTAGASMGPPGDLDRPALPRSFRSHHPRPKAWMGVGRSSDSRAFQHRLASYTRPLPGSRRNQCFWRVRSRIPLRGSPGITPGSLLRSGRNRDTNKQWFAMIRPRLSIPGPRRLAQGRASIRINPIFGIDEAGRLPHVGVSHGGPGAIQAPTGKPVTFRRCPAAVIGNEGSTALASRGREAEPKEPGRPERPQPEDLPWTRDPRCGASRGRATAEPHTHLPPPARSARAGPSALPGAGAGPSRSAVPGLLPPGNVRTLPGRSPNPGSHPD
jgi:hypothetical protein